MLDRMLYNTVLSQVFSPCGRYLVAGNTFGQLAVFDLDRIFSPSTDSNQSDFNKCKKIHTIDSESQICSLASTEQFLIIGTTAEISGWDWKTITSSKPAKSSWRIQIPSNKSMVEQKDINSLWVDEDSKRLFAGCGDNNAYEFDLEDGKLRRKFEGHSDYIHSVHGMNGKIVSASEDGCVKLWDTRSGHSTATLEPHKRPDLARQDLGKWVGAASLADNWIVCGGGPRLALWHLHSLEPVTTFNLPDHGIHVASFNEDSIITGGAATHLYQVNYSREVSVELDVSATTVYSVVARKQPSTVMCVAGSSDKIDLCTNFNYKDVTLSWR